jgi:kynurenine formamidase
MRLIDVSHTVEAGMITYKGLPAPVVYDFLSRADSRAHYALGTESASSPRPSKCAAVAPFQCARSA